MENLKVCYWDSETNSQKERDMTPAELSQREMDIAAYHYPPVPAEVTRRQARQALFLNGYLDQVAVKINAIADPIIRTMAQIEWEDSQTFRRDRPLVISIGTALGMTSTQLDDLFIQAATL